MPTHVDHCSGVGCFGIAAHAAGFQTGAFCEIDPYCRKVLRRHFPEAYIHDDIRTFNGDTLRRAGIGRVGLYSAGIPCQPFSNAGKQLAEKDDRHLWPEAHRFITECRPDWVVIENVGGFVGLALDLVLSELEATGYTAGAFVLPACSVGAPHQRERVWILGHSDRVRQLQPEGSICQQRRRIGDAGENVALSEGRPERSRLRPCEPAKERRGRSGDGCGADVALPERQRLALGERSAGERAHTATAGSLAGATEPGLGGLFDGLASWLDGMRWPAPLGADQHDWEPPRVAKGVKHRQERIKAGGNAIVWQVAAVLFAAIADWERGDQCL